jgi:hypothetical protein
MVDYRPVASLADRFLPPTPLAAYTFLAMNWGTPGWLLIGGIVVLAAIGMHPAARAAERQLQRVGSGRPDDAVDQPA